MRALALTIRRLMVRRHGLHKAQPLGHLPPWQREMLGELCASQMLGPFTGRLSAKCWR